MYRWLIEPIANQVPQAELMTKAAYLLRQVIVLAVNGRTVQYGTATWDSVFKPGDLSAIEHDDRERFLLTIHV